MAPEGRIIIIPLVLLALLLSVGWIWSDQTWLKWVTPVLWLLAAFCLQFFRDPQRQLPADALAFVSPADGRVVALESIDHDEHVGGPALRMSIFLSVFNVHVQRVPIDAQVDSSSYRSGRFLAAFNHQASLENEQAATYFRSGDNRFVVRQIAGAVARRILTYMEAGSAVSRGDRLGYIRFGSRVDVVLPSSFQLSIEIGDSVKGGETVMGYFGS